MEVFEIKIAACTNLFPIKISRTHGSYEDYFFANIFTAVNHQVSNLGLPWNSLLPMLAGGSACGGADHAGYRVMHRHTLASHWQWKKLEGNSDLSQTFPLLLDGVQKDGAHGVTSEGRPH